MSFFDQFKRKPAPQPQKTTNAAAGNKQYTVIFDRLPASAEEMMALPQAALQKPEDAAALAIVALAVYPANKDASLQMLEYLQGPKGLSPYDRQFLADRFRDKDYVPRSYFAGAGPQNNYQPTLPYTLTFFENPYSRDHFAEGYLILHIKSGGADSARQIKLRTKPSTGQWFLWEQFLLADIRQPAEADPWA